MAIEEIFGEGSVAGIHRLHNTGSTFELDVEQAYPLFEKYEWNDLFDTP